MPTLEIYYNPYKMETAVKIDGDDVFNLSSHLVIQEFISNRIPLQTWIDKIEYRSWKGLLSHLVSEDDSDELIIRFHGRALDFEDLKRSLEAQNNSRPPQCRVTLTFPKPQDLRLSDEKMMQNIDYVIEKLRSEEFKKIIEENGKKAATYQAYQDLERNIAAVRNSEFRIVFTGTYSSGKSTIINTLIRHRVLPRTDETTTTRVCKIIHESMDRNCIKLEALDINGNILVAREFDNDEACLNCFETITPAGQKETNPAGVVSICLYMDLSHLYPECNREEMSKRFKLVLVDTPGTDSSNSVSFVSEDSDELRNADKDIALDVVNGNGREMIILCAQKDHYQSESISDLMYAIHKAAQNGYNGFNDRFLFVMNKCDSDDPSFNPAKQKQLFATHLSNSEHWRARNVYLNPRIFMTTAIWEERIQAGVPFYTEDERFDDINKYDLFENYKRYQFMVSKEQPRYLLAPLCDLPEYRKVEMQNTFALALSEGRKVDAVSIQTGIPCIVSAIQEYIERYAYPVKIRALLKTFDTLLEVITNKTNEQNRILDSINKDLGESSSEREGVQADQSKKEEERKALDYLGKRIEDQKGKIERIEPSGSMQSVSERFSVIFESSEIIKEIRHSNRKVNEAELNQIMSKVGALLDRLQKGVKLEYFGVIDQFNASLDSCCTELVEIASELKKNDSIRRLHEMSFLGKKLESFDSAMVFLRNNVNKTVEEKAEKYHYSGDGFWGKLIAGFKNIFAKNHFVKYYELTALWKGLQELNFVFNNECAKQEESYSLKLLEYKREAQKLADGILYEINQTKASIDDYEKRILELTANESELEQERDRISARKDFLCKLQERITAFDFSTQEEFAYV